jgi:hypothetical protein
MRNLIWFKNGLIVFITIVVLWLILAFRSGLFTPHDGRWAVAPGEFTSDGFSHQKKILNLPTSPIAYFETGNGPPLILLHGCPFSAYEWGLKPSGTKSYYKLNA